MKPQTLLSLLLLPAAAFAWGTSWSGTELDLATSCANKIEVTSIEIACDSPGVYYWGKSGSYRNSEVCNYGDKVKIKFQFEVLSDSNDDATQDAVSPYVTIPIGVNGNEVYELYTGAPMCEMKNIKNVDGNSCGGVGVHTANTYFYIEDPNDTGDDAFESSVVDFVPSVEVYISSTGEQYNHDYGYASTTSTQQCSQGMSWFDNNSGIMSIGQGQTFFQRNGLFIITLSVLGFLAAYLFVQHKRDEQTRDNMAKLNLTANDHGVNA